MVREKAVPTVSGWVMLPLFVVVLVLSVMWLVAMARADDAHLIWVPLLLIAVTIVCSLGLFVVNPNEARVVLLFGNYLGTSKAPGFHWVNPFTIRARVSLRIRNFESAKLKVNDHDGNPIEIAAIVVWRVVETAEAVFEVDDYKNFVQVQTESALRNLATSHPYDAHQDGQLALRANAAEISDQLRQEIQSRLERAGVEVIEARISHLAYAPEIASAMLQRQQASAIIAARSKIVEGAVSMVEMALEQLSKRSVVQLDEERKAAMVSNLLVVLCSDRHTQPVVNAGTLHH
jgi:regulator of protease activity HflC (stomatin/prohibitin superfamily)